MDSDGIVPGTNAWNATGNTQCNSKTKITPQLVACAQSFSSRGDLKISDDQCSKFQWVGYKMIYPPVPHSLEA